MASSRILAPPPIPTVSLVMNDLSPQMLLRDLVMSAAILDYSIQLDEDETIGISRTRPDKRSIEAFEEADHLLTLASRMYSLYFSPLLLPSEAAWLLAFFEKVQSYTDSQSLFPWLHAEPATWTALQETAQEWAEILQENSIPPTTIQKWHKIGLKDDGKEIFEAAYGRDRMEEYAAIMQSRRKYEEEYVGIVRNFRQAFVEEMLEDNNEGLEPGHEQWCGSVKEMHKRLVRDAKRLTYRDINVLMVMQASKMEIEYLAETGRLLTPAVRDPNLVEDFFSLKESEEVVNKHKTNVTMLNSRAWYKSRGNTEQKFYFHPCEVVQGFYRGEVRGGVLMPKTAASTLACGWLLDAARGMRMVMGEGPHQ
jgi:hypothetical protein